MRIDLLFLILIVFSCSEPVTDLVSDEQGVASDNLYVGIEERLIPHFQSFEAAALERGLEVDLSISGITANIESIDEDNIAGQCSYGRHRLSPKEIIIDESFWNQASQLYREYIVFHELGHCYLLRGHNDNCTEGGIWESLMRSGTVDGCRDLYNNRTRNNYLDELFIESVL